MPASVVAVSCAIRRPVTSGRPEHRQVPSATLAGAMSYGHTFACSERLVSRHGRVRCRRVRRPHFQMDRQPRQSVLHRRECSLLNWLEARVTHISMRPNTYNTKAPPGTHKSSLAHGGAESARLRALLRSHVGGVAGARKVLRQRGARGARSHACARRRGRSRRRPFQDACTDTAPCARRRCGAAQMTCRLCCALPRVLYIRQSSGAGERPGQAARL
jgi:hypothetical protein